MVFYGNAINSSFSCAESDELGLRLPYRFPLDIANLSIWFVTTVANLADNWASVPKIWYLIETDVTILYINNANRRTIHCATKWWLMHTCVR